MPYGNNAISAGDPQALEKLTAKLTSCQESQAHMKDVNAFYRRFGTCKGFPGMSEADAAALDQRVGKAYSWEKQPYPAWALSNNNAEIKRLEKRISEINRNTEVGFARWTFFDGHAIANVEMNRLQLFFDEKPNEVERNLLKANGFKWAPSVGAWQRQLNDNAIYAAERLDFVKPSDGRTVREHQPKPPAKDAGAR